MKTLIKLALAAVILCSTFAVKAQSIYGTSRTYGNTTYQNYSYSDGGSLSGTSRNYGNTTYHNYYGSDGGMITGTTRTYGNTSYTTLNGW